LLPLESAQPPDVLPALFLTSLHARCCSLAFLFLSIPTCEFVVSFQHTISAPINTFPRPLVVFVASVQSEEFGRSLLAHLQRKINGASRLERRGGRDDAVLLLHELLARGLDGDGKTELGGVLKDCQQVVDICISDHSSLPWRGPSRQQRSCGREVRRPSREGNRSYPESRPVRGRWIVRTRTWHQE